MPDSGHPPRMSTIALRENITLHVRGQSIQLEASAAASGTRLASTFESLKG